MKIAAKVLFFCILFFGLINAARAADQILLGVPTSLKLIEGYESNRAAILAVEEINAKGGVFVGKEKRLFKVESLDIRDGEPGIPVSEALLGIEKLILDKKIYAALVGNFRSEALLAAMDIYSKYKVINIGSIPMSPKFQEKVLSNPEKYKYSFRVCLEATGLSKYMSGLMKLIGRDFGYNKVFIATQDVLWATATGSMMEKWYKDNGWTVLGFERYPTGASDFSSSLMKAKSGGAQLILVVFDMPTSGILVKQWKSMRVPALMAGYNGPLMGSKAWTTFGDEIEDSLNIIEDIGPIPVKAYPPATKFYDVYTKRWKESPQAGHGVGASYDAVYMLAAAIEKAGTLDPDKVSDAIAATDMAGGVVGRLRFDKGHQLIYGEDPTTGGLGVWFQWRKGERVIVYPESVADGKIDKPVWTK
jgi:branched-chain amino acid transport system substrate-binding protein